jgi:hypothetical protein
MAENIGGAEAAGKEIDGSEEALEGEITILPRGAQPSLLEGRTLAVVHRLARDQSISPAFALALTGITR